MRPPHRELERFIECESRRTPRCIYDGKNDFWIGCSDSQQTHSIQSYLNKSFWDEGKEKRSRTLEDLSPILYGPWRKLIWVRGEALYAPLMAREKMRCSAPSWRSHLIDSLLANWSSARAIAQARGGKFAAFLHPHREAAKRLKDARLDWATDLTGIYNHRDQMLLLDFTHPTLLGNKIAAAALVTYLERHGFTAQNGSNTHE